MPPDTETEYPFDCHSNAARCRFSLNREVELSVIGLDGLSDTARTSTSSVFVELALVPFAPAFDAVRSLAIFNSLFTRIWCDLCRFFFTKGVRKKLHFISQSSLRYSPSLGIPCCSMPISGASRSSPGSQPSTCHFPRISRPAGA